MKYKLLFPKVVGSVYPCGKYWRFSVSYSDGSGHVSDWHPGKRGAMNLAMWEARRIANDYKTKPRWILLNE
jgi:hypothetical protein